MVYLSFCYSLSSPGERIPLGESLEQKTRNLTGRKNIDGILDTRNSKVPVQIIPLIALDAAQVPTTTERSLGCKVGKKKRADW